MSAPVVLWRDVPADQRMTEADLLAALSNRATVRHYLAKWNKAICAASSKGNWPKRTPCMAPVAPGERFCRIHGGASTKSAVIHRTYRIYPWGDDLNFLDPASDAYRRARAIALATTLTWREWRRRGVNVGTLMRLREGKGSVSVGTIRAVLRIIEP